MYIVVAHTTPQVTAPVGLNNNREEPRSTPRDLHSHGPTLWSKYQKFRSTHRECMELYKSQTSTHSKIWEITSQLVNRYTQIILSLTETIGADQNRTGCQQTRFDEEIQQTVLSKL